VALWNLDLAFADVVATSSDPHLGAIRLAWWRERLEDLGRHGQVPAEPRLQAVARELLPRRISGKELSRLEDAWLPLLAPFPWGEPQVEGLKLRGRILFGLGARLLGGEPEEAEQAGAFWSLVDGACHCSDAASAEFLKSDAKEMLSHIKGKPSSQLRPLTVLAALSAVDLVRGGSPMSRLGAAVRHRLMGSFPRS
jgi:phytoene synthase